MDGWRERKELGAERGLEGRPRGELVHKICECHGGGFGAGDDLVHHFGCNDSGLVLRGDVGFGDPGGELVVNDSLGGVQVSCLGRLCCCLAQFETPILDFVPCMVEEAGEDVNAELAEETSEDWEFVLPKDVRFCRAVELDPVFSVLGIAKEVGASVQAEHVRAAKVHRGSSGELENLDRCTGSCG